MAGFSFSNTPFSFTSASTPVNQGYSGQGAQGLGQYNPNGSFIPVSQLRAASTPAPKSSSSGNSGSGLTRTQKAADAAAKRAENNLRDSLSETFNNTIDAYSNMIGWLPNDQTDAETQINNLADTQKGAIGASLQTALGRYDGYRGEVATNQKESLQGLADNTRNMFAAGNNYLGSRGAGNSSATGMYSAALTQQSNKTRGDIQNQTNEQYNKLNTAQEDTQGKANEQIAAVEAWKSTRVAEVVQKYQDLKRQLTVAKAQADDSKLAALAELDRSLFDSAINNLNSISSQAAQYKSDVSGLLSTQSDNTGNMTNQVEGASKNYQVGDIVTENIKGMPNMQTDGNGNYMDGTGKVYKENEDGTFTYAGMAN